jgi:hypothetical protein
VTFSRSSHTLDANVALVKNLCRGEVRPGVMLPIANPPYERGGVGPLCEVNELTPEIFLQ